MNPNTSQHAGAATHAAVHQFNNLKPEWIRVAQAVRLFGLSRSAIYEWISSQKIKSTCLRKRGAVRGIRIINYDSLSAVVEQAAKDGGIA